MNIIFSKIHIENFMSMGIADIILNEQGYTLINGINNNPDDSAKSNGAGKSTIFDAIVFCLTGETIRGSKNVSNIYGTDGALVELNFKIDENEYRIIRTKDHSKYKTNLKIFINGEDKSAKGIRDSEKLLAEYLPDLTASLLGSVIILGQGLPQRFTNNSPSGRKEVLEKLSKSDFMLDDLKTRISNRKSELGLALRASEDTLLKFESTKQLLQQQINENKIKLDNLPTTKALNELIKQLNDDIIEAQNNLNNITENYNKERVTYKETLDKKNELNEELVKIANSKAVIHSEEVDLNNKIRDEVDAITAKYNSIINDFNKDYIEASSELKSKKAELVKMQNVKDTCPTCGQKLPGVFKPDTSEIEKAIESLTNSVNDAQQACNNTIVERDAKIAENKNSHINDFKALQLKSQQILDNENVVKNTITETVRSLQLVEKQMNDFTTNITNITNKINSYKEKINSAKTDKSELEAKKATAEDIVKSNTSKITDIDKNIITETKTKDNINKHLDIVNKMSTVITRDFRGYLLKNIIEFINRKAKEYSLDVFETDKIEFVLNGNNIDITYDTKDYSALSGGEKQKVDLIIQFAIRDMLCKYLNFSSNILVLDEITDNVDSTGAEKLFNMISRKLSDVQSIFIITHHASDLQIPCDHQINIIKDTTKISRVEYTM